MSKPSHKTNVPPTTEISLTLTLEEWFAMIAVLQDAEKNYRKSLSAYGLVCFKRGCGRIVAQLSDWANESVTLSLSRAELDDMLCRLIDPESKLL